MVQRQIPEKEETEYKFLNVDEARELFRRNGISPNETKLIGITDHTLTQFNVNVHLEDVLVKISPNCTTKKIVIEGDYCFSPKYRCLKDGTLKPSNPTGREHFSVEKTIPYKN
jgi:hypothetical protein